MHCMSINHHGFCIFLLSKCEKETSYRQKEKGKVKEVEKVRKFIKRNKSKCKIEKEEENLFLFIFFSIPPLRTIA